jgi:hypothetical protein
MAGAFPLAPQATLPRSAPWKPPLGSWLAWPQRVGPKKQLSGLIEQVGDRRKCDYGLRPNDVKEMCLSSASPTCRAKRAELIRSAT